MAVSTNGTAFFVQLEAIQSVTAFKVTEPRLTRPVSASDPLGSGAFRRCANVILYYQKGVEGETGWNFTGWMKESLGRAFVEQPLLCGRLRRRSAEEDGGGGGKLEVVANDSGARLIEAKVGVTLDEFLRSETREHDEAELVHWKDVDVENPQFCPLFYIQVTNFQCGGYSLGISCSLLLADLVSLIRFIRRWATIHSGLNLHPSINSATTSKPIFYLHNIKRTDSPSPPNASFTLSPPAKTAQTLIFKANAAAAAEPSKALAQLCAAEAEKKLGRLMGSEFALLSVKGGGSAGSVKAEKTRKSMEAGVNGKVKSGLSEVSLEGLGLGDAAFIGRNTPALVSRWIGSADEFVMVTPCEDDDGPDEGEARVRVLVTIP